MEAPLSALAQFWLFLISNLFQGQQLMYPAASSVSSAGGSQMVAPLSSAVPAVAASQQLSHGIRQVRRYPYADLDT